MILQENISGIGMWVGGHMWVSFNGDVENSLYLAPIHNISQTQMTQGFQNVTNPYTGEPFLKKSETATPSAMPTASSATGNDNNFQDFNWSSFSLIMSTGLMCLMGLYAAYHYISNKQLGKNSCNFFRERTSDVRETLLNEESTRLTRGV